MTQTELKEILRKHALWLNGEPGGVRANLEGANLRGADLRGANLENTKGLPPIACPEKGSFIGFKKAHGKIIELQIYADAKRSSATTRKCRCSKAKVLAIENIDGSACDTDSVASNYDRSFVYTIGKNVEVQDFCEDRWHECAPGIHFFTSRQEAVNY